MVAPWWRSRSRKGMERSKLVGSMALLLLQVLPSPLSARAEPPQDKEARVGTKNLSYTCDKTLLWTVSVLQLLPPELW